MTTNGSNADRTGRPLHVLLLAPHPFYQERGTPIAVDLLAGALARRGVRLTIAAFHEGEDRSYPGATLRRIHAPAGVRRVPPGFSLKKLRCDAALHRLATHVVAQDRPDLIHAVEESVFLADHFRRTHRIPYVYDMDSSMAGQMADKMRFLRPFLPLMERIEGGAARRALCVVAVCPTLADRARRYGARDVRVLPDVSLRRDDGGTPDRDTVRRDLGVSGTVFMYIGNLEPYQGVDLMLDAFARALRGEPDAALVVAGGAPKAVDQYRARAAALGLGGRALFLGPRPVADMPALFRAADVLVSPRIHGDNTPMKLYSYLDSGRPVLATHRTTHTQAVSSAEAELALPEPDAMAAAMVRLAREPARRDALAAAAADLVRRRYSPEAFERTVNEIYDAVEAAVRAGGAR